jgi:hypothetical protein
MKWNTALQPQQAVNTLDGRAIFSASAPAGDLICASTVQIDACFFGARIAGDNAL